MLPELREINPEASAHIAHSAALLREADAYFHALALQYVDAHAMLTGAPDEATILRSSALPVTALKEYPELVRQYVYSELLRRIGTPQKDWSAVHYRDIDRLIFGPGGTHLDLPYRMSAEYRKKTLILQENREVISVKRRKNHG